MLIRLKAAAQLNGRIHERDEIVDWPDDMPKPMRLAQRQLDQISYDASNGLDANRVLGAAQDEPLWEAVDHT